MLYFVLPAFVFILTVLLLFYFPGVFFIRRFKLKLFFFEEVFFAVVFGIVFFTLLSYYFSWTAYWLFAPILILVISFLEIRSRIPFVKKLSLKKIQKILKNNFKRQKVLIFIVLLSASFVFSLTMITSGDFNGRLKLEGVNVSDSLWHLSLVNELKANFPPDNPGMSNLPLKGYHFFYDFLIAKVSTLSFISPSMLYFQFFPIMVAVLWAFGVYLFVKEWTKSVSVSLWAVYLTMFGGSFGFVIWLQGHRGFSLDSVFGILQPTSSLVNPPFSMSIIIILGYLFALINYYKTKNPLWLIPVALFTGSAALFKVYAGMILIFGSGIVCLTELLKKNVLPLISMIFAGIIFATTFLVFSSSGGLIYFPLWAPEDVMKSNFPWYGFAEKKYTYTRLSVTRGLLIIETVALFAFIIGNLGARCIGLAVSAFSLIKKRVFPKDISIIIFSMFLFSILLPLFFIQTIKVFEIIQMGWYFLFFASLLSAVGFSLLTSVVSNKPVKIMTIVFLIILSIPSSLEQINKYIGKKNYTDNKVYALINVLRGYPYNHTLLEMPSILASTDSAKLDEWYRTSNPFFLAFGNKNGYLQNEYIEFPNMNRSDRYPIFKNIGMLSNPGIDIKEKEVLEKRVRLLLKKSGIKLILSHENLLNLESANILRKKIGNLAGNIYEVLNN